MLNLDFCTFLLRCVPLYEIFLSCRSMSLIIVVLFVLCSGDGNDEKNLNIKGKEVQLWCAWFKSLQVGQHGIHISKGATSQRALRRHFPI